MIARDTCTPVFIAALFIIARTWKKPRCPSADKWIRKLWFTLWVSLTVEKVFIFNMDVLSTVLYRRRSLETTVKIRLKTGSRRLKSKS